MANAKEIKSHIKSVKDTQKITNAMYLIASTKMRKAKADLDRTRPYFNELQTEIKRIFRNVKKVDSRYFYPEEGMPELKGPYAALVITADKGLAGMYNQNVIKEAEKLFYAHKDTKLFIVGEYGRRYFEHRNIPIEQSFLYTAQNPTMQRAREITQVLLSLYDKGEVQKIYVIYTDIKNGMFESVINFRLLPFHKNTFSLSGNDNNSGENPFEFSPNVKNVLDNIIPSYISGYIYSALIDSFCSEQSSRMNAMNSANQNAQEILNDLSVEYNRLRQASITQEITEVSSGAKAQRKSKTKNRGRKAEIQ